MYRIEALITGPNFRLSKLRAFVPLSHSSSTCKRRVPKARATTLRLFESVTTSAAPLGANAETHVTIRSLRGFALRFGSWCSENSDMKLSVSGIIAATLLACNVGGVDAQVRTVGNVPMAMLAPADEYFGPLKMSLLGIDNAMFTIVRRGTSGEMPPSTVHALDQIASAIRDWEKRYPRDPGIGRALLRLHKTYAAFPDRHAGGLALSTAVWLVVKYPHSPQAKDARSFVAAAPARRTTSTDVPAAVASPGLAPVLIDTSTGTANGLTH